MNFYTIFAIRLKKASPVEVLPGILSPIHGTQIMSIIQKIRDKAAWLVFGLIAVSLIGFLLMDARSISGRNMAGASSGPIGSVNGEKLDYTEFQKQVSESEDRYKSQGYPVNDMLSQNIREEVWKQFEDNAVLATEYQKLGIDVSD